MSIAKCVVRLKDSHETVREAVVYAESLYEAVLRGLNQLVDVGWESDTDETIRQVEVEIYQEPTRHVVNVPRLLNWVKQDTMRPGEQNQEREVEEITRDAIEETATDALDEFRGNHVGSLIFLLVEAALYSS
jgi:hypothetical protein